MHTQNFRQCDWYRWLMLLAVAPLLGAVGCDMNKALDTVAPEKGPDAPAVSFNADEPIDASNVEAAIQRISTLTQQAVQANPPDYDKLLQAGDIAEKLRPHFDGLDPSAMPLISQAFYNQACGYSIKKDLDKAFEALDKSIALGFEDKKLMESDSDLDNLRGDARYQDAMKKFELLAKEMLDKKIDEYFVSTSPFPFDFSLEDLEGKTVTLKELQGSKVTIIDFWGTWCPPCRMEIPHFVALHKKLGNEGLQIIGINYERGGKEESITQIKEFSAESGIAYPLVLGDDATRSQVPGFRGYPTTLFLDGSGVVRAMTVGYVSEEVLEGIVNRVMEKSGS